MRGLKKIFSAKRRMDIPMLSEIKDTDGITKPILLAFGFKRISQGTDWDDWKNGSVEITQDARINCGNWSDQKNCEVLSVWHLKNLLTNMNGRSN